MLRVFQLFAVLNIGRVPVKNVPQMSSDREKCRVVALCKVLVSVW